MRRGRQLVLPLALMCLLTGDCALRSSGSEVSSTSGPDPKTAIALSVLAESVYLVDPSTGARAEVVGGLGNYQSGYATWAPDHQRLAFANDGIYFLDFLRHEQVPVSTGPTLSMPAWRADGARLAYGNGISLWSASPAGTDAARIRLPATLAALGMDWGPNADIVFEGLRRDCRAAYDCPSTDQSDVWVVSPDGQNLRRLTRFHHVEQPKWSPDGSRILFIRGYRTDPPRQELWGVDADGSNAGRLAAPADVVAADWSPDGRRIAMVRTGTVPNTLQLWVADSDGSNARRLGDPVQGVEASIDW